jgi:hypothetical protein
MIIDHFNRYSHSTENGFFLPEAETILQQAINLKATTC